jgi:hypothetical protein
MFTPGYLFSALSRTKYKDGIPGAYIINLITAVIYGFRNKLVFVLKHN